MRSTIYNHEISIDKMKGKKKLTWQRTRVDSRKRGKRKRRRGGGGWGRGERKKKRSDSNGEWQLSTKFAHITVFLNDNTGRQKERQWMNWEWYVKDFATSWLHFLPVLRRCRQYQLLSESVPCSFRIIFSRYFLPGPMNGRGLFRKSSSNEIWIGSLDLTLSWKTISP